ncbi:MAG TPA: enterotoxin [Acidobacteriaceae bacterium]|nr:enterotoxin [Acidobacteriaceae bacterium]
MIAHRSVWVSAAALIAGAVLGPRLAAAQDPGRAAAAVHGDVYSLGNQAIAAEWRLADGKLRDYTVADRWNGRTVHLEDPFGVLLRDGTIDNAESLRLDGKPDMRALAPDPASARASDHFAGEEFTASLTDSAGRARIQWSVILRDGSNYVRQTVTIAAPGQDLPIAEVRMIDATIPGAHVVGSVRGSPIVAGGLFLGMEDPLSESRVVGDRATAVLDRELPLRSGQSVTYSSVIGVTRPGQLRRDFLRYVERERAHPYRTFLHYNSWYDLGYFTPYDQAGALDRIHAFGQELHEKRGVVLDSFLFDDGWDDHASLWNFNSGFPDGFSAVRDAAQKVGAEPGVWMSPWGGYDGPKKERIAFGEKEGYEIVDGGFALSGPKYYQRFLDVCLRMIRQYGVNQFKFDGTGNADSVFPGSAFDSDFAAAIHLIGELRRAEPNIYINLTTGTYPSPFWLLDADSIWRGGEDDSEIGAGPTRERWITYRDAMTYQHVVEAGPLCPLNSLMLHGIIYARYNKQLNTDPHNDFRNEVRSYFGTGTQLQEMYITPSLLSPANWDDLAEAAKWSRANADVLRDTHWIGGNPAWLEVYGWASWSPRKGIITLRNPSDHAQTFRVDVRDAFELPVDAPQRYTAVSPWKEDAGKPAFEVSAGVPVAFHLVPFEVLTLDFTPRTW